MKRLPYDLLLAAIPAAVLLCIGVFGSGKLHGEIIDISWPNCHKLPSGYSSGIIGATGGLDFHINPCLSEEVASLSSYAPYMNSGYPGANVRKNLQSFPLNCNGGDDLCHSYNYGYNAAAYAINESAKRGAHSLTWWIDVETDNSWSDSAAVNRANIRGMIAAIKKNVLMPRIGFYSYPGQWDLITADWKNGYPSWVATGSLDRGAAIKACHGRSFSGGAVIMAQYTDKLDINVPCSAAALHVMPL